MKQEAECIHSEDEAKRKRKELIESMNERPFWHYCEVCGKKEFVTAQDAFDNGWDYPPNMGHFGMLSPRTCGNCLMKDTLFWKISQGGGIPFVIESALTPEELVTWRRIKGEPESLLVEEKCLEKYPYLKDYPFLYSPEEKDIGKVHYEVTDYSINIIQKYYPLYNNENKYELVKCCPRRRQMSTSGAYLMNREGGIDIVADIITTYDFIADAVDEQQKEDNEVNCLIYHTIGNILPVCEGINTRWGGADCYWVKLKVLKRHLEEKNYSEYKDILDNVDERIKCGGFLGTKISDQGCLKYWINKDLSGMEWEEFVKQNYLQDFVKYEDDQLVPIELKTMLCECGPEDKRRVRRIDASEIDKLNRMIIKRGYRIWHGGKTIDDDEVENIIKGIKEYLKKE